MKSKFFNNFLFCLSFLSIIPIEQKVDKSRCDTKVPIYFFIFVGLLLGLITAALTKLSGLFLDSNLTALSAVFFLALITGGFHLDGVADTFDAALSWRDRDRKLEIMKDSRIGTMGALALIFIILFKVMSLSNLGGDIFTAIILAPAWGRLMSLTALTFFPLAKDKGLATSSFFDTDLNYFFLSVGITLISSMFFIGVSIIPVSIIVISSSLIFTLILSKIFCGLTGDTYGAVTEFSELMLILSLCFIY